MVEQKTEVTLSGPLIPSLPLELTPEDEEFLVTSTGITDRDALREHVLQIQADAMKVSSLSVLYFLLRLSGRCSLILVSGGLTLYRKPLRRAGSVLLTIEVSRSHIQNLPRYQTILALAKDRPDALILDIGCGCGSFAG